LGNVPRATKQELEGFTRVRIYLGVPPCPFVTVTGRFGSYRVTLKSAEDRQLTTATTITRRGAMVVAARMLSAMMGIPVRSVEVLQLAR